MMRSIGVVLAGYVSIGLLVILTDQVVGAIRPGQYTAGQTPPVYYFVVSLVTAPLYSVFGGYLCARLAKGSAWKHVLALVLFGEAMGLVSTILFWGRQPMWYALGLLVLYPPAVSAGGYLALRKLRQAAATA